MKKQKQETAATKATSKSDRFRSMYKEGYSIAEIARITGDYYSFVHRVIRRHENDQKEE